MNWAFIWIALIMVAGGAGSILYSKTGEKDDDKKDLEFIAGVITIVAGVMIAMCAFMLQYYTGGALALYILSVIGASVGAAFVWVAKKRMDKLPESSDDYKNYKLKWLIGGSVGVGVGVLAILLTLIFGRVSTTQSASPYGGYGY